MQDTELGRGEIVELQHFGLCAALFFEAMLIMSYSLNQDGHKRQNIMHALIY